MWSRPQQALHNRSRRPARPTLRIAVLPRVRHLPAPQAPPRTSGSPAHAAPPRRCSPRQISPIPQAGAWQSGKARSLKKSRCRHRQFCSHKPRHRRQSVLDQPSTHTTTARRKLATTSRRDSDSENGVELREGGHHYGEQGAVGVGPLPHACVHPRLRQRQNRPPLATCCYDICISERCSLDAFRRIAGVHGPSDGKLPHETRDPLDVGMTFVIPDSRE